MDMLNHKSSSRVKGYSVPLILGLAAILLAGAVLVVYPYALRAFDQAGIEKTTPEIFSKARAGAMGDGVAFPPFKPLVADAKAKFENGALVLTTSAEPNAYQIGFSIDPKEQGGLHLSYSGELLEGGFAIGLIASDGSRWIAVNAITAKGRFKGELATAIHGKDVPTVVIANQNPAGVSKISFSELTFRCVQGKCVTPASDSAGQNGSSNVRQYGNSISAELPRAGRQPLGKPVYLATIAKVGPASDLIVQGSPETPYAYLATWAPRPVKSSLFSKGPSAYLYAEGELFQGGLTVGLLDASGNWAAQENIVLPGQFRVVMPVTKSGQYSPMIANNVSSGTTNHFEITYLRWIPVSD